MYPKQLPVLILLCVSLAAYADADSAPQAAAPEAQAAPDMHNSRNSLDWAGVYEGILPCDGCAGVMTRLTLGSDGIYRMQSLAMAQGATLMSASGHFSWLPDGNVIELGDAGDDRRFAVGEGRLTELVGDAARPGADGAERTLRRISGPDADPYSDALTTAFLQDYFWRLDSARSVDGRRVDALFPDGKPFELRFDSGRLMLTGGCNGLRGAFRIDVDGQLQTGPMLSTMMACEPALMAADKTMTELFAQPLDLMLVQGPQPTLVLLSSAGTALAFSGRMTPEALYGPATRVFLEVAANTVPCAGAGGGQCLRVREINFNEQGIRDGRPGPWLPFAAAIEGYRHEPGVRNVLRVNRYQPSGAPAVFVLDLVVESETVKR